MKNEPRKFFNLIEMAFAIAILAVGAICITSILPIGVKQGQTSIGNNYASMAAENMQSYLTWKYVATNADTSWFNDSCLPPAKIAETATSVMNAASWGIKDISNKQYIEGDLFYTDSTCKDNGKYGIRLQSQVNTSGTNSYDFTGELLAWKTSIGNLYFGGTSTPVADTQIVGINLEVSWPVEKPYALRQKQNYYFEMYNSY